MVMAGGQRLVTPTQGGQIMVAARPQQQIVRTTTGQLIVQSGGQTVIRQQTPAAGQPAPASAAGGQRVVINQPGLRPGQPGSQITVPLSTLQSLQPGQGIPTGEKMKIFSISSYKIQGVHKKHSFTLEAYCVLIYKRTKKMYKISINFY